MLKLFFFPKLSLSKISFLGTITLLVNVSLNFEFDKIAIFILEVIPFSQTKITESVFSQRI